jgi:hypothetical protein
MVATIWAKDSGSAASLGVQHMTILGSPRHALRMSTSRTACGIGARAQVHSPTAPPVVSRQNRWPPQTRHAGRSGDRASAPSSRAMPAFWARMSTRRAAGGVGMACTAPSRRRKTRTPEAFARSRTSRALTGSPRRRDYRDRCS